MINSLRGTLTVALPTSVELDVNGVGYDVAIPLSTYDTLPAPPAPLRLLTHLHVTETAHTLYGFATEDERTLFRLLVHHVSGVGPKIAMALLSGLSPVRFRGAVAENDIRTLSQVKGIGRKLAEKIVVELRDKVGVSASWEKASAEVGQTADVRVNDAVLALMALGYKQAEAHKAVRSASDRQPGADLETLVREALKEV